MYQLLAYFFFNFLGFLVFYFIWSKLEKPDPYDYTTIPGLKCEDLKLNKASIVLPTGIPINKISLSNGNLSEIRHLGSVNNFLKWLHSTYGPLAEFHWGSRYTVSVGSLKIVHSLRQYKDLLRPINPFLYSSILYGDHNAWNKQSNCIEIDEQETKRISKQQAEFFINYDPNNQDHSEIYWPKRWYNGPLVIVFEEEVEIDAHMVPANIPILISVPLLLNEWSFDKMEAVHNEFEWIFDECL